MTIATKVNYTYSDNLNTILNLLNNLPNIIACDFEVASKWTDAEKVEMKKWLTENEEADREEIRQTRQFINSTGLSHPSLTYVTHLSVAWSGTESFVAILPTDEVRKPVLEWLATTTRKQIWHNFSFDGKHIYYHTKKLPENYEDTEILAKTLLNHVNTIEAKTGLKHLMGYRYGDWAVSKDNFNLENMYDNDLLQYAAIDSAATYQLWLDIQQDIKEQL